MTTSPIVPPKPEIKCAQCGGLLHPDEGQIFLTCPYCASAVYLDKSKVVFHWSLRCTVAPDAAAASLRRWMAGNQTVKDLDRKARVTAATFEYFPVWYCKTRTDGRESIYLEPAAATSVSEIKSLDIPAGDLEKYESTLDSLALAPSVPFPAMLQWLSQRGVSAEQVAEAALVHLPLHVFKYEFAGKSYAAMVEGATGKVFANIFPAKAESPYLAVAAMATIGFLFISCLPICGYLYEPQTGLLVGFLLYLVVAAVFAVGIFAVAAFVSAKV